MKNSHKPELVKHTENLLTKAVTGAAE